MAVIEVRGLTAGYGGEEPVINDLSFDLNEGEVLGLTGRSGCGKTTVIWAILGMMSRYGGSAAGEILYGGRNLLSLSEREFRPLRWSELALVPQSSMSALNPVFTIGRTFRETLKAHGRLGPGSQEKTTSLLGSVGLEADILGHYPHELSGGMRQRVSLALAVLLDPRVLILDEATTGLDVIVEADILRLLRRVQSERHLSILFVSHDRRLTSEFCHRRIEL